MAYPRKNHCNFLIVYRLIFEVKYRKPLLVQYGKQIKPYFQNRAAQSDFSIKELEADRDHVHLLVSSPPHLAPVQRVRRLKQENSRYLGRVYPELQQEFWKKKSFWSDGYFCASTGNACLETIREDIENQG
ncbi:MAG: IS200/IS605 family transposase [Promethearchaeota archaeon]